MISFFESPFSLLLAPFYRKAPTWPPLFHRISNVSNSKINSTKFSHFYRAKKSFWGVVLMFMIINFHRKICTKEHCRKLLLFINIFSVSFIAKNFHLKIQIQAREKNYFLKKRTRQWSFCFFYFEILRHVHYRQCCKFFPFYRKKIWGRKFFLACKWGVFWL